MTRTVILAVLAISMANLFAYAEPDADEYIRIARISYMEGHVSFQHTSDVDWTAASINFPLRPGDRIYTGPNGRAEIQFDEGSVYRLAESTDIQFLSLREDLIQIRIMTGLSSLTASGGTTFEMDTPAAAFIVLRPGSYRFETRDNGDTDAIVRKGELETVSHRFVRGVGSGERIFVTAEENSSYNVARYTGRDGWDEWNDRRDADLVARASRNHLPSTVYVGASDLDRYGRWVTVESYGVAWVPFSVGVSWSPYSVGRWCYRPVWGWTWVSYEPWGWLPYHYGRWYRSASYGWCWLPGPSFSFNFWSPGLVTFYYGSSWVSWCPLGPGDYYSINNYYYNRRLHHHYVGQLHGLHRRSPGHSINRHVRGAYRTVEIEHFRNGGSRAIATSKGYRQIDRPWNQGTLVRERLAVQPTAKSFSADPDRQVVRSKLVNPRPAVVRNTPSAKAATRDGYVRITNPEVTRRAVARQSSGNVSRSTSADRKSDTGQAQVLRETQNRSVGTAKIRPAGSANSGNPTSRQTVRSGVVENRDTNNRSTARSLGSSNANRAYSRDDSSTNTKSRTPTITNPGNSGNSKTPIVNRSSAPSPSSVSRTQSTPQKARSTASQSVRPNQSSGQSNVSRSSGSSSTTRSYSTPSSSSRSRSLSTPSSSSRNRSMSTPSSSSRTRSYSAPSSSSRTRSYSAPSSSNQTRSYSAPSSSSRTRSYSAPSSSGRSSVGSSSPPSTGNSSRGSSSPRQAKRR